MGIINNLINSLKDNFTMAEFNINGRMTVKSLRKQFKDAFGATLRVYKGAKFAPEDATLASIRSGEGAKGGDFACKGNLQVGNFEAKMKEMFGITVKVANHDNTKLVSGNITIAAAGREAVATDDWSNEQLQCYFWDTLQDLLAAKGYDIEKKDFSQDVEDYYKSTRYKRYGVTFNIYHTKTEKDITFTIYMLETCCYGIRYSDDVVKEKIKETKSLVYPDYFSLLRVNNTLLSLIRSFKESGGKTALASTARRKNLRNILTYIAASDVFDQILAGEDVAAGKPDPEIYIKAMERFGVAAGETLVFEDSEAGFKAAGNAGIPYIKINSTWYNEH